MGVLLRSKWGRVMEFVEHFLDISCHGDIQYVGSPVQCDATVKTPCPILCYFIFFLRFIYEVMGFLSYLVYNYKFVNHEGKCHSDIVVTS